MFDLTASTALIAISCVCVSVVRALWPTMGARPGEDDLR